jgi:hypothetical protein
MIFRLSEKLNAKIKAGTLATLPLETCSFLAGGWRHFTNRDRLPTEGNPDVGAEA